MFHKDRQGLTTRAYMLIATVVLLCVAGLGYALIKLDRDSHLSSLRRDAENALYRATDQIKLRFYGAALVANNIESLLDPAAPFPDREIERLVEEFRRHNPNVVAVALAPGLVITHSYPSDSNRSTIGIRYWEIPGQMQSVARAFRSRQPVINGPVTLVQGGTAFILRYPVFQSRPGSAAEDFWGVISIAISADGLFGNDDQAHSDENRYIFELRETRASAQPSPYVWTEEADVPVDRPSIREFTMLGGTWQASVRPKGGWPAYSPESPYLLGFALLAMMILLAAFIALRRLASKEQYAHALLVEAIDSMDEGFIAFDEDERLVIVNQKYLDYHPEMERLLDQNHKFEMILRLGLARGIYPAAVGRENEWLAERLERFRNPGEPFLQRVGENRWLKVTEARTPHGYTIGLRTDVTTEKRAQQVAEAADREKTEFLNNVSHELRTPLTVILGRASFLKHVDRLPEAKRLAEALGGEGQTEESLVAAVSGFQKFVCEQGNGLAGSAQHMLRLVEDLLDWTRIARGDLELDPGATDVGKIAAGVIEELMPDVTRSGLELTQSLDSDALALADQTRLRQILYNLVSNAIKFTDTGRIHVSMEQTHEEVVLEVSDTGCGIAPENIDRIFQRFYQVDSSMSRGAGGLGLGLAIAHQLTMLLDGRLSVESRVGEGSTFRLALPRFAGAVGLDRAG